MNFAPTFADFQRFNPNNYDDQGRWIGISEADFNRLSDAEKFGQFGGLFGVDKGDARYGQLKPIVGGEDGRSVFISSHPTDPSLVYQNRSHDLGNGLFGYSADAQTPYAQSRHKAPMWPVFALPLAFMGAGALSGAFDGAAVAGAAGDINPGLLSNFSVDTVGADAMVDPLTGLAGGGATGGAGLTGEPWSGAYGGLDPETVAGNGGMGVAQNGIGPGSLMDRLTGAINNPSSLFSSNGLLSGLAPDSLSGLLRLAGGAQTLAGLFGGRGGGGGGGGGGGDGGGGDKGGGGQALKIGRGEFTPNPITQQQLANFRYAQPRSR